MPLHGAKRIDSVVQGVQFGLQSYIFTGIGLPREGLVDLVIASMVETGLGEVDLFAPVVGRDATIEDFREVRKKFDDAGIAIHGMSGFRCSTEEELARTYEIAEVLGAELVTSGIPLSAAKRIVPVVEKHRFTFGIQGNPNMNATNPDAIARPENYEEAVSLSRKYEMSFDIGDATGSGYDSFEFVKAHADRIALLYLKDRRRDHTSVPWGEGDTPIAEILRWVRDNKRPIRCYVDCDYKTGDRRADVKRSFEFAKRALG